MSEKSSFEDDKAQSLVFKFAESLQADGYFASPEPDFFKWMENSVSVDIVTSEEEAADSRMPESKRNAWRLYHAAIKATGDFLELYKADLPLLQEIAGHMLFLPTLISVHPDNERFNRELLKVSRLSGENMAAARPPKPQHLARQSWAVKYAYAIIATIDLTLDTYEKRLPIWASTHGYGIKYPIPIAEYAKTAKKMGWDDEKIRRELPKYEGHYQILPAWTETLERLRRPFNQVHVIDYWRTGKEMIREELPKFHLRPEWDNYRRRRYKSGSKKGAVQNAIFKDILAAMRTIACTNHRRPDRKTVTE